MDDFHQSGITWSVRAKSLVKDMDEVVCLYAGKGELQEEITDKKNQHMVQQYSIKKQVMEN